MHDKCQKSKTVKTLQGPNCAHKKSQEIHKDLLDLLNKSSKIMIQTNIKSVYFYTLTTSRELN